MLEVKRKNLDRREWYDDSQRTFKCKYIKEESFEGGAGLITFTGLAEPEMVDSPKGKLCIADNGYQWLELAPKEGNFVITTMFIGDRIFQHYVDITLRNEISPTGDAVFYDLFLDVVADADGKAMIIDEDELLEAYKDGVIDAEEYDLARTVASQVLDLFSKNRDNLEALIRKCRNELNA